MRAGRNARRIRLDRARCFCNFAVALVCATLSACSLGPDFERPTASIPVAYKELKGWKISAPRDHLDRGAWWSIYRDPILDALEIQVEISNQNIAAADAAYRQSVALVQEARAALFPTFGLLYNPVRSHTGSGSSSSGSASTISRGTLEGTASWDIDLWGKIRRTIESNAEFAKVSAGDLANAKLSAQNQLAVAYFNLRAADELHSILEQTISNYRRTLTITENQLEQGTVSRSDVITAKTQIKTIEAQVFTVRVQRAQFEHAIAVLIGKPPAQLNIAKRKFAKNVPTVTAGVPSSLLERRPDIAAAERQVAAQSALIGVAVTAYFPDINLSGVLGWVGPQFIPINAANEVWQIAGTLTETMFDGGMRRAQLAASEAAFYQAVAIYRQTILTAFQEVEDQLSNSRLLAEQQRVQDEAVSLSQQALDITLNQYKAGTISFTAVVTAHATLLANEQAAVTVRQNRFLASANLIKALGGGWDASLLPTYEELRHRRSCVEVRAAIRGTIPPEMPECL